jgi:hypothetical protein
MKLELNLSSVPNVPNGVCYIDGKKIYIQKGRKHRLNGPAVIGHEGYKAWYKEGVLHRKGKPAVIHPDGKVEYWEEGRKIK